MANCPRCKSPREGSARFCGRCGARHEDPPAPRAIPNPAALATTLPASPKPPPAGPNAWAGRSRTPALVSQNGDPLSGALVDGRYRVLDRLGAGGMGTVYRVLHERMGKAMALKVLHPQLSADPMVKARFKREARAASLLESRHTVAVFDFGETQNGSLYLAMELLRGQTLAAQLEAKGTLSPERAARILIQVLRSLEEAHGHGIVHRDVKPDNIFLLDGDEPDLAKVLDFGIAKGDRITDAGAGNNTRSDLVVGTPEYMAPEQARGQAVDPRADLWAVGVILYECLTGTIPFQGGSSVDVLLAVMNQAAPPLPGSVPAAFETLVDRALKKKATQRYATAALMRADLTHALDGLSAVGVTPPQAKAPPHHGGPPPQDDFQAVDRMEWEEFGRAQARRSQLWKTLAVMVLAAAAGAGAWLLQPGAPLSVEQEPNDTAAQANWIKEDSAVRGELHAPLAGKADGDVFVLDLPAGPRVLSARVKTAAAAPLGITAWVDGKLVWSGYGKREPHPVVSNLCVEGTKLYLKVKEENATADVPPTPQSVPYQLEVGSLRALGAGEEREPNDNLLNANVLTLGAPVRAILGNTEDEDWFRVTLPPDDRDLSVEVTPTALLPVALALHSADGKRLTRKTGRAGEALRLDTSSRRCGSPCYVRVELEGKTLPAEASYTLTPR